MVSGFGTLYDFTYLYLLSSENNSSLKDLGIGRFEDLVLSELNLWEWITVLTLNAISKWFPKPFVVAKPHPRQNISSPTSLSFLDVVNLNE